MIHFTSEVHVENDGLSLYVVLAPESPPAMDTQPFPTSLLAFPVSFFSHLGMDLSSLPYIQHPPPDALRSIVTLLDDCSRLHGVDHCQAVRIPADMFSALQSILGALPYLEAITLLPSTRSSSSVLISEMGDFPSLMSLQVFEPMLLRLVPHRLQHLTTLVVNLSQGNSQDIAESMQLIPACTRLEHLHLHLPTTQSEPQEDEWERFFSMEGLLQCSQLMELEIKSPHALPLRNIHLYRLLCNLRKARRVVLTPHPTKPSSPMACYGFTVQAIDDIARERPVTLECVELYLSKCEPNASEGFASLHQLGGSLRALRLGCPTSIATRLTQASNDFPSSHSNVLIIPVSF